MADFKVDLKQNLSPEVMQRTVLLGRVKMAQAIKMPETEWAKLICEIEKDPLFKELISSRTGQKQVIQYKRFNRSGISGQFYEIQESRIAGSGGGGETPEALLIQKKHLLRLIEKIGQENFEKYFLYREEGETLENISNQVGLTVDEAQQVQDFILDVSVQTEFIYPSHIDSPDLPKAHLVGKIIKNEDGTYVMSFYSPHLARGQYEINHAALREWQRQRHLNRQESSRVRKYVGILELSNLKQGAFWRVMDYLMVLHKAYFDTRDEAKMAPVSLRKVAAHLQFAPSTISRVIGNKSVTLPWDHEVFILDLMPGQRKVILEVLRKIIPSLPKPMTDARFAKILAEEHAIRVSRRTITACRHIVEREENA